jgi:uncharacterized protein YuzE
MLRYTKHAQEAMVVREIALDWIEATVSAPDRVEPDPRDTSATRSYKSIAALDGRVLRVVHRGRRSRYPCDPRSFGSESRAMMRTTYDPDADAMFVWFGPEGVKSAETEEVAPGIMLDFDSDGRVIGIEVLGVSGRMMRPKAAA